MPQLFRKLQRESFVALAAALIFFLSACTIQTGGGNSGPSVAPIAAYCPHLPSLTFTSPITVNGKAYFEYRSNGNGPVSDSVHTITPTATTLNNEYRITINSIPVAYTCPTATCTATAAVTALKALVNADSTLPVSATGTSTMILTPKTTGDPITISALNLLTDTPESYSGANNIVHKDPAPIRFAEVQVTDSAGSIVQCAETTNTGTFTFQLPSNSATYTVTVLSRSNNAHNTAYVMNNPYDNVPYKLTTTVTAAGSPAPILLAKATGNLYGGAFNILDQIYKSQNYMRTTTAGCSTTYADCVPFTTAPVVNTYWSPGVTPSVYAGSSGGISYYGSPDGSAILKGLYILGGINGDYANADMDHFDNSVIVHEYGHFVEDTFGKMDSPGGSHSGNSIIDPRLAWGEGWADFFQGAVLAYHGGNGYYRDTYGHVGCSGSNSQGLPGCTGVSFNENLDVSPGTCTGCLDQPTVNGEGNFREFSIARMLFKVAKSGGASNFAEVWAVLNGTANGFKPSTDRFKTIGRFHLLERVLSGNALWRALRQGEFHYGDIGDYAATYATSGCSSTSNAMAIRVVSSDDGELRNSDQFRNNDFYTVAWPGGSGTIGLTWSGAGVADLDLYLYPQGYTFGGTFTAASRADSNTTSGSESISGGIAAGNYIVNVSAYTGRVSSSSPSAPYAAGAAGNGTYNTSYTLSINGMAICPSYSKDPDRP